MLERRVSKQVIDFSCPVNLLGHVRANKEEEKKKKKKKEKKKHSKKKIEKERVGEEERSVT